MTWMLVEPRPGRDQHGARFEAIGAKLPERVLTTRELMASTRHHTRIDLERLTGIKSRRVCGPGEDSRSLAIDAARDCLARSRYTGADLDMIVCASITHYDSASSSRIEPPFSLSIKEAIGAPQAINFDLSNACAGMLTGVFLMLDLIRRGTIRRGMVVSGEDISGLGTNAARDVRTIFSRQLASLTLGDAGAAVIVDQTPPERGRIELAGFTTLAEHSRLCIGTPSPRHPGARMFTRARTIHKVAMDAGLQLLDELLASRGLTLGDIGWMIPHQTSVRAIRTGEKALAARTGQHPGHMVVTVDELGNTASTTLFVALHRGLGARWFSVGERVLLMSVASGLEIGALVFVMDELQETHERTH